MNITQRNKVISITAKIVATLLLLLWGSFFIEHLTWFLKSNEAPPFEVYVISVFHLLLLVGYVIFLKWALIGSILILFSATIFFSQTADQNFFIFWIVSIIPALIYSYLLLIHKKIAKV